MLYVVCSMQYAVWSMAAYHVIKASGVQVIYQGRGMEFSESDGFRSDASFHSCEDHDKTMSP